MIRQAIKKFLIPAAAVIGAADNHNLGPHCHKTSGCNCKPSELPIYPQVCPACKPDNKVDASSGELENVISKVRSELWLVGDSVSGYKQQISDTINTGLAHSQYPGYRAECNFGRDHIEATMDWSCPLPSAPEVPEANYAKIIRTSVDFLREESNGPERAGAIAIASLSGFIFGLRGGIFKRLTYATIGGLSMAAVCFPRAAAEYSEITIQEGSRYLVAGYHFLFGETPKLPEWAETVFGDTKEKVKEIASKSK